MSTKYVMVDGYKVSFPNSEVGVAYNSALNPWADEDKRDGVECSSAKCSEGEFKIQIPYVEGGYLIPTLFFDEAGGTRGRWRCVSVRCEQSAAGPCVGSNLWEQAPSHINLWALLST